MNTIKLALVIVVISFFVGCQPKTASNQPANAGSTAASPSSNAKWDAYVEQFLADYFTAHPDVAVYAGKHEFDGKLPDWSEDGLKKETARLKAERDKASAFKDADLDDRQRFERDYLIAQIDKDVFGARRPISRIQIRISTPIRSTRTFMFRGRMLRSKRGSNPSPPTPKTCRTLCRRSRQI